MGTDKTDPLKQETQVSILIRAGRAIRGQISLSTSMRKKWNRESPILRARLPIILKEF